MSIIDGLFKNIFFIGIFLFIAIMQIVIAMWLQAAFNTVELTGTDWLLSIGFGVGSLFIGFILRKIHLRDNTAHKLNVLREQRKSELRLKYNGMTAEEQWAVEVGGKNEKEQSIEA